MFNVIAFLETLHHVITEFSASTEKDGQEAQNAFDGNGGTIWHSQGTTDGSFWIKATFGKRVFITAVEFVNRLTMVGGQHEGRNDNADLKTILHEGG